ncbi:MAG: hypothetical protein VYE77_05320 [Planctomycetota bacterium]|nr:hypothetical protein [Planctomycetota bacterium]
MNMATSFSPAPLLRLLMTPRALLVLLVPGSWAFGMAWIGTVARFNYRELEPGGESGIFGALVATMLLFLLTALVGVMVGEAAQEIFRRPLTHRLPGMTQRVSRGALLLGLLASTAALVCVQVSWGPAGWRLSAASDTLPTPLASFSIALLGFATGSWLLVRVGSIGSWILRWVGFFALAYVAQPLLVAGTRSSFLALVVVVLSLAIASQRFRISIVRKMAEGRAPTFFGSLKDLGTVGKQRAQLQAHTRATQLMPPRELERNQEGWSRAADFELRTAGNGLRTWHMAMAFAVYPIIMAGVSSLIPWLRSEMPLSGLVAELADDLLVGSDVSGTDRFGLDMSRLFYLNMASLVLTYVMTLIARLPFSNSSFSPISRRMQTQLVFRTVCTLGLGFTAAVLALGLGLGNLCRFLSDGSLSGKPVFAWTLSINLLVFPWLALCALHFRNAYRDSRLVRGTGLILLSIIPPQLLLYLLGTDVGIRWHNSLAATSSILLWLVYLLAVIGSFALLRLCLVRHFRRVDLV